MKDVDADVGMNMTWIYEASGWVSGELVIHEGIERVKYKTKKKEQK